jgi:hypothetical protein
MLVWIRIAKLLQISLGNIKFVCFMTDRRRDGRTCTAVVVSPRITRLVLA